MAATSRAHNPSPETLASTGIKRLDEVLAGGLVDVQPVKPDPAMKKNMPAPDDSADFEAAAHATARAPTLIKKLPLPLRRFIGDMSHTEKILLGLDLREKGTKPQ